jgi:hypothetical protein
VSGAQALIFRLVASGDPIAVRVRCDLRPPERRRVALSVPPLDAFLGGGLPSGAIMEVFGGLSSGKTTLAHALTSAAVRAGAFAAWIDLPNSFHPERRSGRVLWVAPRDCLTALRAAEQVLEAGGFRVVILDLGDPIPSRSIVPASRWLRMARMAARREAVVMVLSSVHVAGAFAALSLETCADQYRFAGSHGPCPVFEGIDSVVHLRRSKHAPPQAVSVSLRAFTEV